MTASRLKAGSRSRQMRNIAQLCECDRSHKSLKDFICWEKKETELNLLNVSLVCIF